MSDLCELKTNSQFTIIINQSPAYGTPKPNVLHVHKAMDHSISPCTLILPLEALEGSTGFVTLRCDTRGTVVVSDIMWTLQRVGDTEASLLDITGPKYTMDFNRLTVNNIVTDDEGLYRCVFTFSGDDIETTRDAGCLYVLGKPIMQYHSSYQDPCIYYAT